MAKKLSKKARIAKAARIAYKKMAAKDRAKGLTVGKMSDRQWERRRAALVAGTPRGGGAV